MLRMWVWRSSGNGSSALLPEGWVQAELRLRVPAAAQRARATALLGPLTPGRVGEEIHFHRLAPQRRRPGGGTQVCSRSSTTSGSAALSSSRRARAHPRALLEDRARAPRRSLHSGTRSRARCRPTGATSSAGSSWLRATTCPARRCWRRRSIPPPGAGRRLRVPGRAARAATAPPRRWCAAASDAWTSPASRARSRCCGRSPTRSTFDPGAGLVRRAARSL